MALGKKDKKTVVADEALRIVTFGVGAEAYGLDINSITEAVRPLRITALPRMPQFVEGVVNLRGAIIPVVDLRKRFGLAEIADNARTLRMMIVKGAFHGAEPLGLVVDSVQDVLHVPKKQIEPAPEAAMGPRADFIAGVAKVADRLVILVDITKILSREERAALAEAGNVNP
jgi:purine-binding chemotaxis protein CheW